MEEQGKPIIVQTGQISSGGFRTPRLPASLPKIIFIVLSMVIVGELIWGVWYLTKPRPQIKTQGDKLIILEPQEQPAIEVKLNSKTKELRVGDTLKVDIVLAGNADGIVGMDLLLKYDPKSLSLVSAPTSFASGNIFPEYLGENINPSQGIFSISGTSIDPISISEEDDEDEDKVFGSLSFKALKSGNTLLQISYQKGSTTETNVMQASSGLDVIDKIRNLSVKIN